MTIQELLQRDDKFRYQMLSRLQLDCNYYLGNGGRNPDNLWALNEKEQIETMKALWISFPEDGKPEWLSYEDILIFESQLIPSKDTDLGEGSLKNN